MYSRSASSKDGRPPVYDWRSQRRLRPPVSYPARLKHLSFCGIELITFWYSL